MFTPKEASRPAPSWAAPMMPSPAPVIIIQPASVMRAPKRFAWRQAGAARGVRALPNTETLRRSSKGLNTRKAWRSSLTALATSLRSPTSRSSASSRQRRHDELADGLGALVPPAPLLHALEELFDQPIELRLSELVPPAPSPCHRSRG